MPIVPDCLAGTPAARYCRTSQPSTENAMTGIVEGKIALVTGGGGGIGRAAALAFAREGARVAVADFAAGAAHDTVAQINAAGGQAITLTGDVTRAEDVRAMIGDTRPAQVTSPVRSEEHTSELQSQ